MKATLTLTGIFAFVGFVLTYLVVPSDLKPAFSLLAALGVIGGYPFGTLSSKKIKRLSYRLIILGVGVVVCAVLAIAYMFLVQAVSANTIDIVILGLILTVFFFAFSFLLAIAGIALKPPS